MNGKLHGKQIKDLSVKLGKFNLTGGQGDYILGTGSQLGAYAMPSDAFQYANKAYVDSIATGLEVKEAVKVISVTSITLSGTQSIDGVVVGAGDRVLVAGQGGDVNTAHSANGIYVVATGAWSRSADMDQPNEINGGEFAFVTSGSQYADTGWVASKPDGGTVIIGTTPIQFTQFSSAGVVEVGNGLVKVGNLISVDLATNSGLTFSNSDLAVASTIAGDALGFQDGVLNVKVNSDALEIVSDEVKLKSTIAGNRTFSNNVSVQGTFGVTGSVDFDSTLTVGDDATFEQDVRVIGNSLIDGTLGVTGSVNFESTLTVGSTATFEAGVKVDGNLGVTGSSTFTGAATFQNNVQVNGTLDVDGNTTLDGNLTVGGQLSGAAFELLAGAGITFSAGVLNIGTSSTMTVNADNIEVRLGSLTASRFDIVNPGSASQDWRLAYNGDGRFIWLNPADSDISEVVAGAGLTGGGDSGAVTLNVVSANKGITVNADSIELTLASTTDDSVTIQAGATGGLNLNRTQLALNLTGDGLTQSAGVISTNAGLVKTTLGLSASSTAIGSSIQSALTALDNQTMVEVYTTSVTIAEGTTASVGLTFSKPSDGVASIYINGLRVKSNGAVYFAQSAGSGNQYVSVNDNLYINTGVLGYGIEPDDVITVEYYTLS